MSCRDHCRGFLPQHHVSHVAREWVAARAGVPTVCMFATMRGCICALRPSTLPIPLHVVVQYRYRLAPHGRVRRRLALIAPCGNPCAQLTLFLRTLSAFPIPVCLILYQACLPYIPHRTRFTLFLRTRAPACCQPHKSSSPLFLAKRGLAAVWARFPYPCPPYLATSGCDLQASTRPPGVPPRAFGRGPGGAHGATCVVQRHQQPGDSPGVREGHLPGGPVDGGAGGQVGTGDLRVVVFVFVPLG